MLALSVEDIYWMQRRLIRYTKVRPPIPTNAIWIKLRRDRRDPLRIPLPRSPEPHEIALPASETLLDYGSPAMTPPAADAPRIFSASERFHRAAQELQRLHQQQQSNLTAGTTADNRAASEILQHARWELQQLHQQPSTSIVETFSDITNAPEAVAETSFASTTHNNNNNNNEQITTDEMPRSKMFRRKPVPIASTGKMPKSTSYVGLRGDNRTVSLPGALNVFVRQTAQSDYQKAMRKELEDNLNCNGTSATFLRQVATKPGRKTRVVENFGDDYEIDLEISGPLGADTVTPECIAGAAATTLSGDTLRPSDATLRPSTAATNATTTTVAEPKVLSSSIFVATHNLTVAKGPGNDNATGIRRVSAAWNTGVRKVSGAMTLKNFRKPSGVENTKPEEK